MSSTSLVITYIFDRFDFAKYNFYTSSVFYKIATTADYGVTRLHVLNTATLITFNFPVVDTNLQINKVHPLHTTTLHKFNNICTHYYLIEIHNSHGCHFYKTWFFRPELETPQLAPP